MMNLIGNATQIFVKLNDERWYELNPMMIRDISFSLCYDDLAQFSLKAEGTPAVRERAVLEITGYLPADPKDELKELTSSSLGYCLYCGSEWRSDTRGNCGACGGTAEKSHFKGEEI
jgi:hypothetical protein